MHISEKPEEAGISGFDFKKHPAWKVGDKVQNRVWPKLLPGVPEILEFVAFRNSVGRPLKTTFDMTTLIFSSGGCPSYPFYPLKRVPLYPFLAENPSSEGATKDHLSSKPPQGEPPGTKNQSGR